MANAKLLYDNNRKFGDYILSSSALQDAVEWITNNLYPEDVFDYEQLEEWAKNHNFEEKE